MEHKEHDEKAKRVDEPQPRTGTGVSWMAGGSVAAFIVFFAGLIITEQRDVASLKQEETDHNSEDARARQALQEEIDRRFKQQDEDLHHRIEEAAVAAKDLAEKAEKISDTQVLNVSAVAELKAQVVAMIASLTDLRARFDQGRAERMSADASLSDHYENINARLTELQRQVSAIEGKLGDSLPNPPPPTKRRN